MRPPCFATINLCRFWQLNTLGLKLKDIVEQRNKPGHPRPEEEIYLSKLSAEADKQVSAGIRAEVRQSTDRNHKMLSQELLSHPDQRKVHEATSNKELA